MAMRFPREFYIPKGSRKVADKASDAVAYIYESERDGSKAYLAAMFWGKQAKPSQHYRYRTEERRAEAVAEFFKSRREHDARMAERRSKANAFQHSAKVGDIYRTSWGYDQTNVEFFEIIEIKGKFAVLREIACASESDGYGGDKVVPQSGAFLSPRSEHDERGRPIRRLIQDGHIKICDVRHAWPWGKREPITGTIIGEPAHATSFGCGH